MDDLGKKLKPSPRLFLTGCATGDGEIVRDYVRAHSTGCGSGDAALEAELLAHGIPREGASLLTPNSEEPVPQYAASSLYDRNPDKK